jgi:hypothetical protein
VGSDGNERTRQPAQGGLARNPVILEFRYRPAEHDAAGEHDADGAAEQPHSGYSSRAELARELNASIYKAGQVLSDPGDSDFELTFVCACGCMAEVRRSLQEYARQGAVLVGHSRNATPS